MGHSVGREMGDCVTVMHRWRIQEKRGCTWLSIGTIMMMKIIINGTSSQGHGTNWIAHSDLVTNQFVRINSLNNNNWNVYDDQMTQHLSISTVRIISDYNFIQSFSRGWSSQPVKQTTRIVLPSLDINFSTRSGDFESHNVRGIIQTSTFSQSETRG